VEGSACGAGRNDGADDGVGIAEDVAGRNAESAESEFGETRIAGLIAGRPIPPIMRFPVDLDREPRLQACEIEDISIDRMLAAKFETTRPRAQNAPQQHLRKIAAATFPARANDGLARGVEHPSTTRLRRAVPLPVPGRYQGIARHHIRNTPKRAASGTGAFSVAAKAKPSTSRVWAGSTMPSSHNRAVA